MNNKFPAWTPPVALLFTCLLAYGPLILWLGFYWDDWPTLWYLDRFSPSIFPQVYSIDRPALGWLFFITTTLVGKSPLAWQFFGILTRWLACLSLWWLLLELWPRRKMENTWAVCLFALYPGFLQQPIAFTYSADWIAIALFFLSFWLMLRAVRGGRWPGLLFLASWLLAAYVMFADEYYFGLEFLRPIFLWLVISQQPEKTLERTSRIRQRIARVFLYWLPYLLIMLVFLYWRLFIFVSPRGQLQLFDQLANQPVQTLLSLASVILSDIFQSSMVAWAQAFDPRIILSFKSPLIWLYLGLIMLAAGATFYYFKNFPAEKEENRQNALKAQNSWSMQASLVGGFALLMGGWPFWVTDLPIELYFPWDRFNLAMMFGASLVLAGLTVWLTRTPTQKALVFSVVVSLTIGFHLYNANRYKQEWQLQKDFFWQLTWRIPQLKSGTLLLTAEMPFRYFSDNSLTAPLNLIYAPEDQSLSLPYMLYNIESRLGGGLTELKKNVPINQKYRIASFRGNTNNTVVFIYDPPRCLRVVDPLTDHLLPRKPLYIDEAAGLSNLSQIINDTTMPAIPTIEYFGAEPESGWCTYFQKADLARQSGNWQEIARLGYLALALPHQITRDTADELIPYIQGYAHTEKWEKAETLTLSAYQNNPKLANMLCPIWYDIRATAKDTINAYNTFDQIVKMLDCEFNAIQTSP